ncbi:MULTISPECIES: segregation/condensation protein A [unclassified Synechocystis]|uniref:segregation/condensation protein A n=1 Tax=unclassified Synechocystis TaxID=2640012 RepID=UPI0004919743|nr:MULTISPECIES: segregation/condensation protein A [unclassified Synechocystis]AIE75537.1 Segregation and condensation protein A [Synechocystis sp. PCC 6714]MCT0253745.1 segregation/condensation protein A [Synechocystis sp. CS-94]
MTSSAASHAIDTLIEMAHQGEINPWDVSVIDVIDRFLQDLGILSSLDLSFQQQNLPRSGQAFLWASMLVRYKADTLHTLEQEPEEILPEAELEEWNEGQSPRLPKDLENRLRRRTAVPPLQRRRVTLAELIDQIEAIAVEIEKSEQKPKRVKRARPQSRREALQIITELAHQENLTELASQLEQFLQTRLPEILPDFPHRPWVDLDTLLRCWHHHLDPDKLPDKKDKVGVFWALLLLSSQSKVALSQEEFYEDLQVQIIDPEENIQLTLDREIETVNLA